MEAIVHWGYEDVEGRIFKTNYPNNTMGGERLRNLKEARAILQGFIRTMKNKLRNRKVTT